MTIRKKLVYLCDTNNGWVDEVPAEEFADYLIENGVTIPAHGKWDEHSCVWYCSVCNKWIDVLQGTADMNYCPNCGARMDKED